MEGTELEVPVHRRGFILYHVPILRPFTVVEHTENQLHQVHQGEVKQDQDSKEGPEEKGDEGSEGSFGALGRYFHEVLQIDFKEGEKQVLQVEKHNDQQEDAEVVYDLVDSALLSPHRQLDEVEENHD